METAIPAFQKYVFVCENERATEECSCGAAGMRIREALKSAVKELGASNQIRVSRTGCLDVCSEGPNVLVMPDNVWFKRVTDADIPQIMKFLTEGKKR